MLGLHYAPGATAVTVARNVAHRGVLSHFCLCVQVLVSIATFSHVLSRSAVTEARRRDMVCHGWFYFSSHSFGTSHVLLRRYQVLIRLSSSVKVFYDEPWAMNGV